MNKVLRYQIKKKIGSGGMATVYLAEDEILRREVAVKMVHPHLLDRPETIRRFANEAKAVAKLSHENVVRLFDYGEEDDKRFLVMEYVDGVVLDSILEQRPPLPALVVMELMKQILSGLQAAHREGIYHRDIKPGNIMVDKNGCVKIMDFGIAFLAHQESITLTGTFVGSPNYISPEQAAGEVLSGKTDVFSVGALAFQCITGVPPFQAENAHATIHRILHEEAQKADQLNPRTLFGLADIVDKCLIKAISRRPNPEDCRALIDDFLTREGLETGAGRLIEYIAKPKEYTVLEERELYTRYMASARKCSQDGQVVTSLRCVNQAKAFGPLSSGDAAFVDRLGQRKRRRETAIILLRIAAIILLGFAAQYFLKTAALDFSEGFSSRKSAAESTQDAQIAETAAGTVEAVYDSLTEPETEKSVVGKAKIKPVVEIERNTRKTTDASRVPGTQVALVDVRNNGKTELSNSEYFGNLGHLKLQSRPPWAVVRIDGIELGETPITLSLKPGEYMMSLTKKGYRSVESVLRIENSDTLLKRVELLSSDSLMDSTLGMK